ncbi:PREDICTED: uncharacterized protein LOC104778225 [Camelina sativa]|uniref:Uncharacterized protein LOC104778225 n=1 Tax=Camelina sativa TaxID=90675 RepID=A0ABM0YHF1_CAMSA|nr:PREDICTED: uncharacterized protein LOC104778225 [Camelina sativa]
MGVVAFEWAEVGDNQLTLVMNRDNWANREISRASRDVRSDSLSGRCKDNGGTWFAISSKGRVAFLMSKTLLEDKVDKDGGSELYPIDFMKSNVSPEEFADHVARCAKDDKLDEKNNGWSYSLIVADLTLNSMVHIRKPHILAPDVLTETVPFGVHTLSPDGGLDSTEARDLCLRGCFNQLIGVTKPQDFSTCGAFICGEATTDSFSDSVNRQLTRFDNFVNRFMCTPVEEGQQTVYLESMSRHTDGQLGMQRFGTTSATALVVERTGEVTFFENYRETDGGWTGKGFTFKI